MDIIRLRGDKVAPESQCQIPRFESGFSNRDNRQCSLCNITVYIVKIIPPLPILPRVFLSGPFVYCILYIGTWSSISNWTFL